MNKFTPLVRLGITEKVQKFFGKDSRILAVFLLGSAARDSMRPESDIDLAIMSESGTSLDILEITEITGSLSHEFARTVDLGEISSKNLVYAREVLLTGIPVYQKDTERVNLARANLLGLYVQFNLDRKEVLDAYRAG